MLLSVRSMMHCKGRVNSLESFGSADGPGVRFVVFLKGCPMRCRYCHNPETWNSEGADEYDVDTLVNTAMRYKSYWGKNGGVTVSGGEPLLQLEFVTEFFKGLKEKGVHTAIDTSGQPFCDAKEYLEKFDKLLEVCDLVILDLKEFEPDAHKELTGFGNENILKMAEYLSDKGKKMWIRHVLVPGITDGKESLEKLGKFIKMLKGVERTELLPYHTLGVFKWEQLGIEYSLKDVKPPTEDEINTAKKYLMID